MRVYPLYKATGRRVLQPRTGLHGVNFNGFGQQDP